MKVPDGYTAEELDRDNPYNAWMYEDQDVEEIEEDDGYCHACAGTGEGQCDGASCTICGGRGFKREKAERDE